MAEAGYPDCCARTSRSSFGHEFCGEVLDHGPGTQTSRGRHPRRRLPLVRAARQVHPLGLSTAAPGAYAEQLIVEQSLAFAGPQRSAHRAGGADRAHGRRLARRPPQRDRQERRRDRDRLRPDRPGRHPHAQGPRRAHRGRQRRLGLPPSTCHHMRRRPRRRPRPGLALRAPSHGHLETVPKPWARRTVEKLHKLRLPWWHVWRAADAIGAATPKRPVVFECVGVPGTDRRHHHQRAAVRPRRRGRGLHGRRPASAVDGDQQRSTCASCSATRRSSSATRSTCSPTARSTSPR